MTPLLILSGIPAIVAIGTDIVYAAFAKIFASLVHIKNRNVEYKIIAILLTGSIPGIFAGYYFSIFIGRNFGQDGLNIILTFILSALLISLSLISIINEIIKLLARSINEAPDEVQEEFEKLQEDQLVEIQNMTFAQLILDRQTYSIILGAFIVGLLVQLTSVGSGVLITILLLNILPAKRVVGTELVHASVIVGISAIIYTSSGYVDYSVLWKILSGAIFGILIGVKFANRIPKEKFKTGLLAVILFAGIIVLYEGALH